MAENSYVSQPTLNEEMGPIITGLKEGTLMTRFTSKKSVKPEPRIFMLKLDEFQVVWCRIGRDMTREEGAINIREIKEIRRGINSRDFEKNPEQTKKLDVNCCLVIFYGTEFKLKTLSCAARNHKEREFWVKGLVFLMYESLVATQPLLIYRWLLREWNSLTQNGASRRRNIGMRDVKTFLQKNSLKVNNARLRELMQIADRRGEGQIDFEGFKKLYDAIMNVKEIANIFSDYIERETFVPTIKFQKFLQLEQEEQGANSLDSVKLYMLEYLSDNSREYLDPFFTVPEFLDYLFSRGNSIFNTAHCEVYQDMTKPLNHYWIASSHNTYLTGDQFQGDASVEAYTRSLRMGCRCLELDCWDGPDGNPVITHGLTLVPKIKFVDVVRAIKDHAFVASDFPLILSLENHCTLQQQKVMAQTFKEIFGDMLLTQQIDPNEAELPSPMALKKKIILKHKKIQSDPSKQPYATATDTAIGEDDLSQSVKNGYLLLEEELDHKWHRHFFCLTKRKLYWTEEQTKTEEEEDDDDWNSTLAESGPKDELHFGEKWFHGKLKGGRRVGESLLNQFNRGDGSFLVRESDTFVGDFSLSFWYQGRVNHCRIKSKQENGQTKYFLVDQVTFDSLYSLINYYQSHHLRSINFGVTLTEAIPQPNAHLDKEWYHNDMTREKAEDMLKRIKRDQTFLVRRKDVDGRTGEESYAISFRAEGKIKHCRIKHEGRLFTIGNAQFESLVELVEFYTRRPLYKGMKLRFPCSEELLQRVGEMPDEDAIYTTGQLYLDPTSYVSKPACRALWDYEARSEDEMSFCKGAFITNVIKEDGGWWKGDYGDQKDKYFPANYCEELNLAVANDENEETNESQDKDSITPLGALQKDSIDLQGCSIEMPPPKKDQKYLLHIVRKGQVKLEAAAETQEELNDWIKCLHDCLASSQLADKEEMRIKQKSIQTNIDRELSDLIVYFQPVPFDIDGITGRHWEMSSFPETRVDRYINRKYSKQFVRYHQKQISRVYPKGSRIDSSNYDPSMMWCCGAQLMALNYQTPDRAMQLNHGKFMDNGRCGYVLMPECVRQDDFDPYDREKANTEPWTLTIKIIGARHLVKSGRGIASTFVEMEIVGAPYDNNKVKTSTRVDNGLNPVWLDEEFAVDVINPPLAYIRFVVYDEDMFGEPNFIGHAIYPLCSLKQGYRSVPLKNAYSEELELSSLLIHLDITSAKGDDENLYASIQVLRDRMQDISHRMQSEEKNSRKTINMLSQQTGPSSMEAQQCLNQHEHVMEDLGRQFRQHQNDLMRLQRHRAQKSHAFVKGQKKGTKL